MRHPDTDGNRDAVADNLTSWSDDWTDARESRRAKRPRRKPPRGRVDKSEPPQRRGRITEEERARAQRQRADVAWQFTLPDDADRWTTWDDGERGPEPYPSWLVTALGAYDVELGVLKTGKEADVHLLDRRLLDDSASCLLAAKRYRNGDHRLFHRDAGYLEGRRARKSREQRAIETRSAFGRNLIAEQWAVAEFAALSELWRGGAPVPYPAQRIGTELLLEFVGSPDGAAAPRLAEVRHTPDLLEHLWRQARDTMVLLARLGYAHGDLSPYNLLVDGDRLVMIDVPQIVDVVANPRGADFLRRDVGNCCRWFVAQGLSAEVADAEATAALLAEEAGLLGP